MKEGLKGAKSRALCVGLPKRRLVFADIPFNLGGVLVIIAKGLVNLGQLEHRKYLNDLQRNPTTYDPWSYVFRGGQP
jgi:hypothetical protein